METWNNLSQTYLRLQSYQRALDAAQKAVEADSQSYRAYNSLGFALIGVDRYEEAMEAFNKALALEPNFPDSHFGKGVTFLLVGNREGAAKEVEILKY